MDALLSARLRRQWPMLGALLVLLGFAVAHVLVFTPLAKRFQSAQQRAAALGLSSIGGDGAAPLPPSVYSLFMTNSLPANEADAKGASGALGAELVQSLSTMASQHGLEVVVAEPGVLTQQPAAVETRAHIKVRGSYAGLLGLLDDLDRSHKLVLFERFSVTPVAGGRYDMELYVSSCTLRRTGGGS